jgi:hypothetical protein
LSAVLKAKARLTRTVGHPAISSIGALPAGGFVPKQERATRLNEAQVKLVIGDWLTGSGLLVYDEKPNALRPQWRHFEVRNIDRGKRPDLLVQGMLTAAQTRIPGSYVAIEIKPGYKHHDILDGFDAILDYFGDYIWGAEYSINDEPVEISAFVFATLFSRDGYLFAEEGKFDPRAVVRGPWDAYPMTFTISRLLWRQKDNTLKRMQTLAAIPKIERKLKATVSVGKRLPEIGVLVRDPTDDKAILLMLSKNPYHWHLQADV